MYTFDSEYLPTIEQGRMIHVIRVAIRVSDPEIRGSDVETTTVR